MTITGVSVASFSIILLSKKILRRKLRGQAQEFGVAELLLDPETDQEPGPSDGDNEVDDDTAETFENLGDNSHDRNLILKHDFSGYRAPARERIDSHRVRR